MEKIITIIAGFAVLALLHFFGNPFLFIVGRIILRILTLKRYPSENPNQKQIQITIAVGFIFCFTILFSYFFIRNN